MAKKDNKKNKVPFAVLRKGVLGAVLGVSMFAGGVGILSGCEQATGKNGSTWLSGTTNPEASQGVLGDFYYDTDDYKIYQKGENGWILVSTIKPTVSINEEGYWEINGAGTGVKAVATEVSINEQGYWVVGGTVTDCKAEGENGSIPEIKNGIWWIGTKNTGVEASGTNGKSAYQLAQDAGYPGTEAEWIASLKGEKGSVWYTGEGNPTIDAKVDDYYLDTQTSDVYVKTATGWVLSANIKGDDAITISSFRKVVDESNKWGMVYYYELTMSDNSKINSAPVKEIVDNYYYTATENGDVETLIKEGVKYIKLGNNIALNDKYDEVSTSNTIRLNADLNLDLNGYTLTSNNRIVMTGATINITNGAMMFATKDVHSAIQLQGGAVATLNDVELNNENGYGVCVLASKLDVVDSKITADIMGVTTNAGSEEFHDVNIVIKDSVVSTVGGHDYDNTAILMNVPGNLLVENSEVYGDRQAMICRGGETTVKNSKVVLTADWACAQTSLDGFYSDYETWLDGNKVPSSAIVLGNNSTTAYQYSAGLTLENADVATKKFIVPIEKLPYIEGDYWYLDGINTGVPATEPQPGSAYEYVYLSNIYAQGNTTEEGKEYIGATFKIKNENLNAGELYLAEIDYDTVKMSIDVSNKETLDEAMKFVKTMTMMNDVPVEVLLSILNLQLTQDIIIIEEEMSYSTYNEYMQANYFLASEESPYEIEVFAMSITVATADEFMNALEGGPVKLVADIELTVDANTESYIREVMAHGYIDQNGYNLTFKTQESEGGQEGSGEGSV